MFLKPYYQNIMFNSCVFDNKHFSLKKNTQKDYKERWKEAYALVTAL